MTACQKLNVAWSRYTRLDAYPLFILAKDVIRRLLHNELHSHDNEKLRLALELSQLKAKLAEVTRSTGAELADLRKRCEDLTKESQSLRDLRLQAEQDRAALQRELEGQKFAQRQAAEAYSKQVSELTRGMEEQGRQHEELQAKFKRELEAAHTFDEEAIKSTLQKLLADLEEFNTDGRDHHEDKLLLLRRICSTFVQREHVEVFKAVFSSLGEFDVTQLPDALTDPQRTVLLQSILAGTHPTALLDHLGAGSAELTDATVAILREALAKGCDIDAILALLESQLGRESLLAKLRGEVAELGTQWEALDHTQAPLSSAVSASNDLPRISKHLRFLHKQHSGVSSLHLVKAQSMIGDIYEQKALADQTDDVNNHKRTPIPEFLHHWALHRFGLRSIANKNLAALIVTIRENEALALAQHDAEGKVKDHGGPSYDIRLRTFGYLSGISSSAYEHTELPVNFCIDLLRRYAFATVVSCSLLFFVVFPDA